MSTTYLQHLAKEAKANIDRLKGSLHTWAVSDTFRAIEDLIAEILNPTKPAPDRDDCPPTHPEDAPGEDIEEQARDAMTQEIKRLVEEITKRDEIIVTLAGKLAGVDVEDLNAAEADQLLERLNKFRSAK